MLSNLFISQDQKIKNIVDSIISERSKVIMRQPIFEENASNLKNILSKNIWEGCISSKRGIDYITEKLKTKKPKLSNDNSVIVKSPYRYDRIDSFFNTESYFSRSISRQIETMLRNGIKLVSEDPKLLVDIKKEFTIIEMKSSMSFEQMIWRWVKDIQAYGVIACEKMKKSKNIVRIRPLCLHNSFVKTDKYNQIVSFRENRIFSNRNQYRTINKNLYGTNTGIDDGIPSDNLIFYTIYDAGDEIFPLPPLYQSLNDILTLRSLEETVELLSYQFGSPLIHNKIGTTEEPADDSEVSLVHNKIVEMAPNGMISTDHRVNIEVKYLQRGIGNLIEAIEYFKTRVIVGSGTSSISVGESTTANRATSESLDDALTDHCTYLANIICGIFNHNIIPDILFSKNYQIDHLFDNNGELKIKAEFNEMRLEKQLQRENNTINKWNNNIITLPETRRRLKEMPLSEKDENNLILNKVQIPLRLAQKGFTKEEESKGKYIASISTPSNQYGTKMAPGSKLD